MAGKKEMDLTAYFQQGSVWEADTIRTAKRSRNRAWFMTGVFGVITVLSVGALAMLTPLKSFEPYMVIVDKSTGYTEVKTARNTDYETLGLTERQAVTQANVVRFIRMREGYDPFSIEENFGIAALLSTGEASRELQELYSATNSKNPAKLYGKNKRVLVDVKSVTFPNDTTALVRFSTTEKSETEAITRHFISVLRYRYTSQPERNEWMFDNPLGFQVVSYRRDQETTEGGKSE